MKRLLAIAFLVACGGSKGAPGGGHPRLGDPPPPPPDGTCRPDPLGSGTCEPTQGEPVDKLGRGLDVTVGPDVEVVGAIPKDSIHRVVRDNFNGIRQCYETLLLGDPTLEGRVLARFKVGIDGTVSDATATGVHPALETCVAEKIRKFRFPKPDGAASVEVTYPLLFKPG
jgi:hypothetical protein